MMELDIWASDRRDTGESWQRWATVQKTLP